MRGLLYKPAFRIEFHRDKAVQGNIGQPDLKSVLDKAFDHFPVDFHADDFNLVGAVSLEYVQC